MNEWASKCGALVEQYVRQIEGLGENLFIASMFTTNAT